MIQIIFLVYQIIHDSLHDEIVEKLKKAYGQVRIGDPLDGKLSACGNHQCSH